MFPALWIGKDILDNRVWRFQAFVEDKIKQKSYRFRNPRVIIPNSNPGTLLASILMNTSTH